MKMGDEIRLLFYTKEIAVTTVITYMDIATIDNRIHGSKPVKYVTIGGIIVAIISFFLLLFLFFKFLFGLGGSLFASSNFAAHAHATSTAQGSFFGLPHIQAGTSTTASANAVRPVNATPVYAQPIQNGGSNATPVYAEPYGR